MNTSQAINGEIRPGDWVVVTDAPPYSYLVGCVNEIVPLGSPGHDTGNASDDIHVNFVDAPYSEERQYEIISQLDVYQISAEMQNLDDVIIAPQDLIRISELYVNEIERLANSQADAMAHCKVVYAELSYDSKLTALHNRFEDNLTAYHASLMDLSKREIMMSAEKITAMSDAYAYLTNQHGFEEPELDFLLGFQNPLEVIADEWARRREDVSDVNLAVSHVLRYKEDAIADYPLVSDTPARMDLRRFMDVDLRDFLGKIADKVIVHHPGDWNLDKSTMYQAIYSKNPDDRRLMWQVSSWGTHLHTERETFIRDTGAFNAWVDYRPKDPDMFGYVVEVTGFDGKTIRGNVFEVGDNYAHSLHVRETALVLDCVTLTYSDSWGVNTGKTITVPRYEYDNDRHRLMSESGNVIKKEFHPSESVRKMSEVLQNERSQRMMYPIGSMEAHIEKLTAELAQIRDTPEIAPEMPDKDIQAILEKAKNDPAHIRQPIPKEPPSSKKPSLSDRIKSGNEKVKEYKAKNPATKTNNKARRRGTEHE